MRKYFSYFYWMSLGTYLVIYLPDIIYRRMQLYSAVRRRAVPECWKNPKPPKDLFPTHAEKISELISRQEFKSLGENYFYVLGCQSNWVACLENPLQDPMRLFNFLPYHATERSKKRALTLLTKARRLYQWLLKRNFGGLEYSALWKKYILNCDRLHQTIENRVSVDDLALQEFMASPTPSNSTDQAPSGTSMANSPDRPFIMKILLWPLFKAFLAFNYLCMIGMGVGLEFSSIIYRLRFITILRKNQIPANWRKGTTPLDNFSRHARMQNWQYHDPDAPPPPPKPTKPENLQSGFPNSFFLWLCAAMAYLDVLKNPINPYHYGDWISIAPKLSWPERRIALRFLKKIRNLYTTLSHKKFGDKNSIDLWNRLDYAAQTIIERIQAGVPSHSDSPPHPQN